MRRGQTDTYPEFPEITAQLGYNPARFLVPTDSEMDQLSWTARAKAFIRGMEDAATIDAWRTVERALGQGANGGPRKQVVKWLDDRQAALDGTGSHDETPTHESSVEPTAAPTLTEPTIEAEEPSASMPETGTATEIAADGGTTSDETPMCPDCQADLTREAIAGKTGYWCPHCGDFREPAMTEAVPA